jgi:hypothetical protein
LGGLFCLPTAGRWDKRTPVPRRTRRGRGSTKIVGNDFWTANSWRNRAPSMDGLGAYPSGRASKTKKPPIAVAFFVLLAQPCGTRESPYLRTRRWGARRKSSGTISESEQLAQPRAVHGWTRRISLRPPATRVWRYLPSIGIAGAPSRITAPPPPPSKLAD